MSFRFKSKTNNILINKHKMEKTRYIKRALLQVTFVAAVLVITSCNNNSQKPKDTKDVAEEHNEAKFDNNKEEKDAQFLVNAAEINLEEIQLGQLAQQNGTTAHVKELGKMMVTAHTKSQNDLTALAKTKMITIPTSPTENAQEAYKKFNEKSGIDFDKAYADQMVSKHKDAIATFEKASNNSNDADIKNWATASLTDLRKHLDQSIDCQEKCNKM
jgi:putative membrane protein